MPESTSVKTQAVERSTGPGSPRMHQLALLFLAAILWIPRMEGPIDLRWDAGVYYVLGTSLAEGKGYRLLSEPGEIAAVQYPPLLPAIVALHQKALGSNDPVVVGHGLRIFYFLLSLLYPLATYVLARRFLPPRYALFTATLTTLYAQTFFLSDLLFAEIPFALVTVLFLTASGQGTRLSAALAPILAVAAYLLRSVGIALLLAWVGESLLRKRLRQAALRSAVALVPIVLWQGYVGAVTSGPEYLHPAYPFQRAPYQYYNVTYAENIRLVDPFRPELGRASPTQLATRLLKNTASMAVRLGEGVFAPKMALEGIVRHLDWELGSVGIPEWLPAIPTGALSGLILLGLGRLLRRGERLIVLYVLAALGLICLTPWPGQFSRYLAPLTPLLGVCLSLALLQASRLLAGLAREALVAGVVVGGVLVTQTYISYSAYRYEHPKVYWDGPPPTAVGRLFYYDASWRSLDACLDWLKAHATAGDVVATSVPQYTYLRTGLQAVMAPMEVEVAEAQRLLDAVPVRYLIVDDLKTLDIARRYASPVVWSRPDLWELVGSPSGGTRIYRRR